MMSRIVTTSTVEGESHSIEGSKKRGEANDCKQTLKNPSNGCPLYSSIYKICNAHAPPDL